MTVKNLGTTLMSDGRVVMLTENARKMMRLF